jgi:flavin reductase (DIM6/NTAB) family NADH-FMN oxidoreductase RutF
MIPTTDAHKSLAAALGRIPSGLFIVTLARDAVETGMLASWVQQCSFSPPLVSFAVQRGRPLAALLTPGSELTINLLEAAQTDMIAHFGKGFALTDDAFNGLEVTKSPPHGPILQEALAYLHAKVVDRIATGDHEVFIAEVTAGAMLDEGAPMVHIRKNGFHY